MRDQRAEALARILVGYSTAVKKDDVCIIGGETTSEPLAMPVYEEIVKAGGHAIVNMSLDGQAPAFFGNASDAQLDWISPPAQWAAENADVTIRLAAESNTRALSNVPPERQTRRQTASRPLMEKTMKRSAEGDLRWVVTLFPTPAYAAEANMSLADYEDFYYRACLCDRDDPVAAWKQTSEETRRLADWMVGKEEVQITGPGTDLRLNIAGRTFIAPTEDTTCPTASSSPVPSRIRPAVRSAFPFRRSTQGVRCRE